jgi:multiple sugar transport system permease protein
LADSAQVQSPQARRPFARPLFAGLRNWRPDSQLLWGVGCAAPALLGFGLWKVAPVAASFVLALTDWNVARSPRWVGLENFRRMLFHDPLFWKSLWVTSIYAAVGVPIAMTCAFALALLLNTGTPGQRIFRTLFYLPSIMPTIAVSVLWLWILNPDLGLLNALLGQIGLPHIQWLTSETLVLPTLILMSLWNLGPMMIIFLAALQDVPQQLYDAVSIDGGGAWARLRHVTIPLVTPAILFNLVIGVVGALQTFTQAYVMTDGGPNNASLFLVFYIYREGFRNSNMGYASALSWGLFAIIAIVSAIVFTSARRWVHYEAGER